MGEVSGTNYPTQLAYAMYTEFRTDAGYRTVWFP